MATLASLLVKLGVSVDGSLKAEEKLRTLKKRTKELGEDADTTRAKAKKLALSVGKGFAKAAAVGAAAFATIGVAMFTFVNRQAEAIDSVNKMSAALGISVEEMQRLNFVAGQSGVSASSLQKGILKLNDRILELSKGTVNRATQTFAELGITFEQLDGRTATEQFGIISDALLQVDDLARRSALSATLLGKTAGPELASLIATGSQGINELAASTQNVLSQEQADRASEFRDRIGELTQFLTGLAHIVAVELAPPIVAVIEAVQGWMAANEEIINSGLDSFLEGLTYIWEAVSSEVSIVWAILKPLVETVIELATWIENTTGVFSGFYKIIVALFTPLQTLLSLIGKAIEELENLGLASEGSAARFRASTNDMIASASAFDVIRNKANAAGDALFDFEGDMARANPGFDMQSPAERQRNIRRNEREDRQRKAAAKAMRGGGGGGRRAPSTPKPAASKVAKPVEKGITAAELRERLLTGDFSAMDERLRGIAASTTATANTKPSVVVTYNNTTINNDIDVHETSNPLATARAVQDRIAASVAKAGLRIPNSVVR